MPEEFGLINENNSSLKEAEEKIKLMSWKKQQDEEKRIAQEKKDNCEDKTDSKEPNSDSNNDTSEEMHTPISTPPTTPEPANFARNTPEPNTDKETKEGEVYFGVESVDEPEEECQNATATSYSFSKSYIEIEGMGKFAVNVTNDTAELLVNGKAIDGVQYMPIANLDPKKFANVNSFAFQEPKHKGLNIQIIITNFSRK